ncbi:MAG: hypothetical protein ACKO4T_08785 [Planctomycetaceae bacterium]
MNLPGHVHRRTLLGGLAAAAAVVGACAMGAGVAGCARQSGSAMIAANNDTNVKRLGTLYGFFHLRNELRGPRDEDEFRAFIRGQDPNRLALAGIAIESLDALFVSERDGQRFRIRYGIDTRVRGPALPVVFEQVGRDGRRQVGFTGGAVEELDTAAADALWAGTGHPSPAPGDARTDDRAF